MSVSDYFSPWLLPFLFPGSEKGEEIELKKENLALSVFDAPVHPSSLFPIPLHSLIFFKSMAWKKVSHWLF